MARVERMLLSGEWVDVTENVGVLQKGDVVRCFTDAGQRVEHLYDMRGAFVADVTGLQHYDVPSGAGPYQVVNTWAMVRSMSLKRGDTVDDHDRRPIGREYNWRPARAAA